MNVDVNDNEKPPYGYVTFSIMLLTYVLTQACFTAYQLYVKFFEECNFSGCQASSTFAI